MQIDMHYYGTYCLARSAGLTKEAARVIANAAQFVDDNAQESNIELADASSCEVSATAHHTLSLSNIDKNDQRQVWVPFHFLPGNEGGSFTEKLVCRKDSMIAQEMCRNHLEQTAKAYFLPLVGIMAHVYADTFAHYGFSGVSSRKNRLINDSFEFQENLDNGIKDYILNKKKQFYKDYNPIVMNIKAKGFKAKLFNFVNRITTSFSSKIDILKSTAAEELSGALGHGAAVTFPDRPYLEWRFNYQDGTDSGWHNNPKTFLEFSEKIHQMFQQVAKSNPEWEDENAYQHWDDLAPKVERIIKVQGKGKERIEEWKNAATSSDLFKTPESIPAYTDWNKGFQDLQNTSNQEAMKHPIYGFYQAASYHRWYVLRDLLPSHGLMVA